MKKDSVAFLPRMQSEAHGFTLVDDLVWRGWGGVVLDIWNVRCEAGARGAYTSPDPRLFVVLDLNEGGALELRDPATWATARHDRPFSLAYIPAGVAIESRADDLSRLKHLDIHMPEAALMRRFGKALDPAQVSTLRLRFEDARVASIAGMLQQECASPQPLDDHFGAGLIDALLTALFQVQREKLRARPSLSRRQLSQSLDFIDAHCFETIRLHDLASLLGLSETYFSHAFKASTGVPPLRWQMETRIGKVKELLARDGASLTEIAAITGFSDQAHLTRSFKRLVGVTPSTWRRNALARPA